MRHLVVPLCIYVLFAQIVNAQDATKRPSTPPTSEQLSRMQSFRQSNTSPDPSVKAEQSYFVQFTEFRFKHAVDLDVHRTSDEIVLSFDKLHKEGKIELIETIRLSALEYHENSVQFGKTMSVTSGVTRTAQGLQQQSRQTVPIGTMVQVKPTPQEGKVLLKVTYTVSRMHDNIGEEKQPDIVTVQLNSTLLLEIGKATLVGGFASDENDFLMVTIRK